MKEVLAYGWTLWTEGPSCKTTMSPSLLHVAVLRERFVYRWLWCDGTKLGRLIKNIGRGSMQSKYKFHLMRILCSEKYM
jgi:hypothetical protein